MRIPKIAVVFDRKHRSENGEKGDIEIRISMNCKKYYISTGKKSFASDYPNRIPVEDKERISVMKRKAEKYINDCIESGKEIDINSIRNILVCKESKYDFIDFVCERAKARPVRESTRKRYDVFINMLDRYGKINSFSDITVPGIMMFDDYLHNYDFMGKKVSQATIYNYHKQMKAFINDAILFDKIQVNPYNKIKIDKGEKQTIDFLTEDEIKLITKTDMPNTFSEHAKDLFIFQTWTALSYSDMAKFDIKDYDLIDGKYIKCGERVKTSKVYVSMILTPAMNILKKYNMKLPMMSNAEYNKALKIVAAVAGIHKRLHSHMSRSTFATYALSHGASIANVSVMLGHTNVKQTMERYAKILPQSVIADLDKLDKK